MKGINLLVFLFLTTKIFAQKEIRTYAAVNLTNPQNSFYRYDGELNIEGALGFNIGSIKLSNKFMVDIEPIFKLKWYGMENRNITSTDYYISATEIGSRFYPVLLSSKGKIRDIVECFYVDISYTKLKLMKVNIDIDKVVNTISYGFGINLPIYDMSDLGFESELKLNAGMQQYNWKSSTDVKSSFAGMQIGLSFAIKLDGKNKNKN